MTKVAITIPASLLPYFRGLCQVFLKNPRFQMRAVSTVSTLVLQEWTLSKIQKLHLQDPKAAPRFRLKPSEACAIFDALSNTPMPSMLEDVERNQLLDDIARQLPQLINTSPV